MARNLKWTREELILALDLYFRLGISSVSQKHPEILELSKILNALPGKLAARDVLRFRNPNGVYMKLCNFLRLDPIYTGVGLSGGGKLEEVIWKEFCDNRLHLRELAGDIRKSVVIPQPQV